MHLWVLPEGRPGSTTDSKNKGVGEGGVRTVVVTCGPEDRLQSYPSSSKVRGMFWKERDCRATILHVDSASRSLAEC